MNTSTSGPGSDPDFEAVAALRRDRVQVPAREVERVLERLRKLRLAEYANALTTSATGRPPVLSGPALLAGMFLTAARHHGRVPMTQVADLLHYALPLATRRELRIRDYPDTANGFEGAYAATLRAFHRLADACDPSPLPKNKRLERDEAARIAAEADLKALDAARQRLTVLSNLIVEDSLTPARVLLERHWDGSVAVDGTAVGAYSKGMRSSGSVTATDPDAAWHVRTGDHADPETGGTRQQSFSADGGRGKPVYKYAYEATFAVARDPRRDGTPVPCGGPDLSLVPALVLGFILDKPGHRPGANAATILANLHGRGYPPGFAAGDRLFNNSDPALFQLPIRALGYKPVFDYRDDQLGIHTQHAGAIQIEGAWYCPEIPAPLIEATTDLKAQRIDRETWTNRIAARTPYLLMAKQAPDPEGHQRFSCPAAAGKVHCPRKPGLVSPEHPRRHLMPIVFPQPSPVAPPKVCAQASITIPPQAGAKHDQDLQYGTAPWAAVYFRLRNSVEGINGFSKDPAHENIEAGATRRIRGIAATSILLAFQIHHANTRKLATWADTLAGPDGQPPRRRPTRRRATKPLGTWTPAGHLTQPSDPADGPQ